jgi:ATP-dependent Lhr-like helicase
MSERAPGGFAGVYRVLSVFEESGRTRRGYFVEGLGAAQFAVPGAVDRLRAMAAAAERDERDEREAPTRAVVLAATDPANPYGAALPWPGRGEDAGHKPGRKAGALVVLVDGDLAIYVERGGRTLLTWTDDAGVLQPAVDALALAVREGHLGRITVERADGVGVLGRDGSPLGAALETAGFHATPRGLRLRS